MSEHVGSRSEKDCIARFIRLPFGEQFMGPKEDRMGFENNDDNTDEPGADVSKRLRLTPLADASNPIMAQVCIVGYGSGPEGDVYMEVDRDRNLLLSFPRSVHFHGTWDSSKPGPRARTSR